MPSRCVLGKIVDDARLPVVIVTVHKDAGLQHLLWHLHRSGGLGALLTLFRESAGFHCVRSLRSNDGALLKQCEGRMPSRCVLGKIVDDARLPVVIVTVHKDAGLQHLLWHLHPAASAHY